MPLTTSRTRKRQIEGGAKFAPLLGALFSIKSERSLAGASALSCWRQERLLRGAATDAGTKSAARVKYEGIMALLLT
jgi:hypothetical protein